MKNRIKKRPLYGAAILLFLLCLILPPSLWMHTDIPEGRAVFTGKVERREVREDGMQVLCLNHVSIVKVRRIIIYLKKSESQYFIGNTLYVQGTIKTYDAAGNPGQFDSLVYYQTQKTDAVCFPDEVVLLEDKKDYFRERLLSLRLRMEDVLERQLGVKNGTVLKAMLLGNKESLPDEVKELYQKTGISHLLAISGLHISILGAGLYKGLRKAGLNFWLAGIPAWFVMGCYGILTGAGVSTLRALTMFFLMVGADLIGRTYDLRTALGFSAIWLLLEQPLYARNAAFLLSFGAVLGLAEVVPLLEEISSREGMWNWLDQVRKALCTCLGIQMVTLPVLLYFYYEIPIYSPLLNLFVLPFMGILLTAGIFCILLGFLVPSLAFLPAWICHGILGFVEMMARLDSNLPGSLLTAGCPGKGQIILYYMGLAVLLFWMKREVGLEEQRDVRKGNKKRRKGRVLICGCIYLTGLFVLLIRPQPEFFFTMLDVGQGDAICFTTRGGSIYLIDGGSTSKEQVGKYILEPFLKYYGHDKVDYLFVSHLDQDHISGIKELLEEELLKVGCLILPDIQKKDEPWMELRNLAIEKGAQVQVMGEGDLFREGKLTLRCLAPEHGGVYENRNAGSLVLSLEYKKLRILLTGDLEGSGESKVVENGFQDSHYDILKVAHHGSAYSTGEEWLNEVQPFISLISCGENNSYGHPHPELLERLENTGSQIYQTVTGGAVLVESDGETYQVRYYKKI